MDSTTSDPQPHQLQAAPPPTPVTSSTSSSSQSQQVPSQQHQHYHQHQHQQQQQPKPHQNQQPHHQHPAHHPHSHQHLHHPSPTTQQANFQYQQTCMQMPGSYHVRTYGPPTFPPSFTPHFPHYVAANFSVAQPPPLTTTVGPHLQSNVPQLHNKSSTPTINPALCTDNRPHNQTLQSATLHNQVATNKDPQERRKAILKHPETLEEIPWENSSKSTSSSSSTTKETSNASAPTNNSSGEHVHAFLQKVSETTNSEGTNNSNKQPKLIKVETSEQEAAQNGKEAAASNDSKLEVKSEDNPKIEVKTENDPNLEVETKNQPEIEVKKENDPEIEVKTGNDAEIEVETENDPEIEVKTENDAEMEVETENDPKKVKLEYEPGQYNPLSNREGKRIYSRRFLLDVEESIIDTLRPQRGESETYPLDNHVDFFDPKFSTGNQRYPVNRQNEPARRQSQHNYAGRSSAGQEKQRKVITSASLTQEVELKTTSNPWRPTKEIKEDVPSDITETDSLKKKFRSILNKLTPDNFENLKKAVTELDINTESNLGEVIDIVFAKALAEPGYCVLYGQMCSHLKKITAGTANFGTILLQRCQQQFQSDIYSGLNLKERKEKIENEQNPEIKKQLNEELYEEMYRCRMHGLGLIKFIGELYKIEMLNDQIMFDCVIRLLSDTSEESLECLCDLLTTIGEKLDRSTSQKVVEKEKKAPRSASKANAYQGGQKSAAAVVASGSTSSQQQKAAQQQQASVTTLDQVFEQLQKIRKNKDLPLSVRIRFKLLDTCELREKYNWQSKKTKDNNPKKTKEIREAHQEKLKEERQQNAMGPRRSQEGRRGLGHSGGSSSQLSSLANESGGNRGNMHTSSSSHLLRDLSLGDNMKTNHDIDAIKEHQRKLHGFRGITALANTTTKPSSDDQTTRLGPQTSLRPQSTTLFRRQTHLSPVGRSSVTSTTTTPSNAAEPAAK